MKSLVLVRKADGCAAFVLVLSVFLSSCGPGRWGAPHISAAAGEPYTAAKHPAVAQQWGEAGLQRINDLRARAAKEAFENPSCGNVKGVEYSDNSMPPGPIIVVAQCGNGARIYFAEGDRALVQY